MANSQAGGCSILIVEGDDDLRESLAAILSEVGCQVHHSANGLHALRQLQVPPLPDLILMDLTMPVMDGWVFRRLLQKDPVLSQIPVAIISAAALSESRVTSLDTVGYLTKPVDLEELMSLVARHSPN